MSEEDGDSGVGFAPRMHFSHCDNGESEVRDHGGSGWCVSAASPIRRLFFGSWWKKRETDEKGDKDRLTVRLNNFLYVNVMEKITKTIRNSMVYLDTMVLTYTKKNNAFLDW